MNLCKVNMLLIVRSCVVIAINENRNKVVAVKVLTQHVYLGEKQY